MDVSISRAFRDQPLKTNSFTLYGVLYNYYEARNSQ